MARQSKCLEEFRRQAAALALDGCSCLWVTGGNLAR